MTSFLLGGGGEEESGWLALLSVSRELCRVCLFSAVF